MIESKSIWNVFVIRFSMFICVASIPLVTYSQEKKFSSFELMYDITQHMRESNDWPKYGLESMQFYNDTIYTLLIKENFITSIPLNKKGDNIGNQKISLPANCFPVIISRSKGEWYLVTIFNGILRSSENYIFKKFINDPQKFSFENIVFVDNRIVIFESNSSLGLFTLYDLNGNLLSSSKDDWYIFTNPFVFNNVIRDGYFDIQVENNVVKVSDRYDPSNYGNYNFVGGCQNMGFFVERDNRNEFVIRDLRDKSVKARFFIPVKFSDTDLGIPEEDSFNLRVFSQDNETFYFVTIKHKHLLIYKAVR